WELTIKTARRCMVADVVRDGRVLVQGQRIVADAPIIPYRYLSTQGNFAILTPDGELPWWESFGYTHMLVYMTPEELGLSLICVPSGLVSRSAERCVTTRQWMACASRPAAPSSRMLRRTSVR